MDYRKLASLGAIVLGALLIVGGVATWTIVRDTLADQNITVADDAPCQAGEQVNGPYDAFCQAEIIEEHTLDATDGRTYAELDRDDPLRDIAMRSAFLRTSLFTSVVAFGVSAMAIGIGLLFILIGLGMRDVSGVIELEEEIAEKVG